MKSKDTQTIPEVIIPKSYYIIKVTGNFKTNNKWFKIGEGFTESRPNGLVAKYEALRANTAKRLEFRELPYTSQKRLNDKLIHKYLLQSGKFKQVDDIYVQHFLQEKDGKNEFFELIDSTMTDEEVVAFVNSIVNSIPKNQYKVKNNFDTKLVYRKDQFHLVNNTFLKEIFKACPEVYKTLYTEIGNKYLLIGQFDFDFICSLAMYNEIYIWHDAAENKHDYTLDLINDKIHYIDNLKELVEMDIKFRTVLENAPYGKIGAVINDTVRSDVDWDYCVSLLPIKDMPEAGLDACNYLDIERTRALPPHTFKDADILTHILIFKKDRQKNYTTLKEVIADSFIVDKPFIKFMRANELRDHYAIDNIHSWNASNDVTKTFVFHGLAMNSQHTCGLAKSDSNTFANAYNYQNVVIDTDTPGYTGHLTSNACRSICFNTDIEKINIAAFCKKYRNFINRMIANQFISIRDHGACFPKVDWKRSDWTPELILKEVASYSDDEIKAVIDSMNKDYAIMNDDDINRLFGDYLNEIK